MMPHDRASSAISSRSATASFDKTESVDVMSPSSSTSSLSSLTTQSNFSNVSEKESLVARLHRLSADFASASKAIHQTPGVVPLFSDRVILSLHNIHLQQSTAAQRIRALPGVVALASGADVQLAAQTERIRSIHQQFQLSAASVAGLSGSTPLVTVRPVSTLPSLHCSSASTDPHCIRDRCKLVRDLHVTASAHVASPCVPTTPQWNCRDLVDSVTQEDTLSASSLSPSCFSPSAYAAVPMRPDEGSSMVIKRLWKYRQLESFSGPALLQG